MYTGSRPWVGEFANPTAVPPSSNHNLCKVGVCRGSSERVVTYSVRTLRCIDTVICVTTLNVNQLILTIHELILIFHLSHCIQPRNGTLICCTNH